MNKNFYRLKFTTIIICFHFLLFGIESSEPYHEYKFDKNYYISKINSGIHLDGLIDEDLWENIASIKDLIQVEPKFNQDPTSKTDIKLCYDDNFLYVAVFVYEDYNNISYKKGDYDDFVGTFDSNSDYFILELDSYHDHETSYGFAVNSSGIKADYMIYNDEFIDDDWNGSWFSQVSNNNMGWSIEYKIPFSVFRYSIESNKTWGINFVRYIKINNEYITWVSLPQDKVGIVSQYGHLHGLELDQRRYLQLNSHGIYGNTSYDDQYYGFETDNLNNIIGLDFEENQEQIFKESIPSKNVGFNLKYIVNSNSNIDFTFRPNFEYINQDPSEINNTPYETYYDEKREFFVENSIFFNTPMQIFYSRRIGGVEMNEDNLISFLTDLDSAMKYTFKNNKLNYGVLLSYSTPSSIRNAPYTYNIYSSIFRLARKFSENNHSVGIIGTNSSNKNNNSNVYGIDYSLNFINNQLYINSQIAFSNTRSQSGQGIDFKIGFRSNSFEFLNKNIFVDFWFINNEYDKVFNINDLGYLFRNDLKEYHIGCSFNNEEGLVKSRYIIQYYLAKNYSNDVLSDLISFKYNLMLKNLSYLNFGLSNEFEHFNDKYYDNYLNLDLEKIIKAPNSKTSSIVYGNDIRKSLSYILTLNSFKNNLNDTGNEYILEFIYKPTSWVELNFSYESLKYYETYHFLKIRQLPNGININPIISYDLRDSYQYLFTNSNNKEIYYTSSISTYLDKITLQLYSEYFIYENRWIEDGNIYKIDEFDENYIYPILINSESLGLIDYNTDKILYSAYYSSINLNFVLQWKFLRNSNIYFLYSFNKGINGQRFSNLFDLISFDRNDINADMIAELFYDNSFFIKYELYFKN